MKICTACNATYSDDTLNFCLTDGTTLTPEKQISFNQVPFSYDPNSWSANEVPTQVSSAPKTYPNSDPPPTVSVPFPSYTPPNQPFNQPYNPQNFSSPPSNPNRSFIYAGIAAVTLIFGIVIGLGLASKWSKPSVNNYPVVSRSPAANSATVYTNPSPASTSDTNKPVSPSIAVIGIWKGTFDKTAATLNITTQNGDTFSGTLSKSGYVVEVLGQINQEKRTVSIKETKVLKTPPDSVWNLGQNNGSVSSSGKTMSGTGRDKNISYDWNFTKD